MAVHRAAAHRYASGEDKMYAPYFNIRRIIGTKKQILMQTQDDRLKCHQTTDIIQVLKRYAIQDRVEERFLGFFDVSKNKSAERLPSIIMDNFKSWKVENRLVCQTYDGVFRPLSTCNIHQMNLALMNGSKHIKQIKLFICDLIMFHTFFSKSTNRSEFLREQGFKLSRHNDTRWNYHSRAAATVRSHFSELRQAAEHVIDDDDWDPVSVSYA
ncbi:hypothetical protein ANN_11598 [Periplaneta americana]|uniref:Uncharacterized protein n=1 Tax=Periplaneta americana TaxID=6978 RepID=A0ABQ8T777_PERAM|nr:hypothetical protein ANN_11598 [Periplaneta americana]